jgi:hypothetical protein
LAAYHFVLEKLIKIWFFLRLLSNLVSGFKWLLFADVRVILDLWCQNFLFCLGGFRLLWFALIQH